VHPKKVARLSRGSNFPKRHSVFVASTQVELDVALREIAFPAESLGDRAACGLFSGGPQKSPPFLAPQKSQKVLYPQISQIRQNRQIRLSRCLWTADKPV
jgi:hypothetical protein